MASSTEESNWITSIQNEVIWECQTNIDPWDKTQVAQWTPYPNEISSNIERAYKCDLRDIQIDSMYRIDLKNLIQQRLDDPDKQRPVRRQVCPVHLSIISDKDNVNKSLLNRRLSNPVGVPSKCSATKDENFYGCSLVKKWILEFTEKNGKITFNSIFPVLVDGLKQEGEFDPKNLEQMIEIINMLNAVRDETVEKRNKKRIEELQECCVKIYTKECYVYRIVNKTLRDEDWSKLFTIGPFSYLVFNYIDPRREDYSSIGRRFLRARRSIKSETIKLYRGDHFSSQLIKEFQQAIGDNTIYFKWRPFVSTSRSESVARRFQKGILYIIELDYESSKDQCIDLTKISDVATEEEVLLRPGVRFQVTNMEIDKTGKMYSIYIRILPSLISNLG